MLDVRRKSVSPPRRSGNKVVIFNNGPSKAKLVDIGRAQKSTKEVLEHPPNQKESAENALEDIVRSLETVILKENDSALGESLRENDSFEDNLKKGKIGKKNLEAIGASKVAETKIVENGGGEIFQVAESRFTPLQKISLDLPLDLQNLIYLIFFRKNELISRKS